MHLHDLDGLTEQAYLTQYNPGDYARPSVASDIVIFTVADLPEPNRRKLTGKELCVLLIRRGGHPYLNCWALPGGFVRPAETVGAAAYRELLEETGVNSGHLEQLYTFSTPGRDPRTWVMSCAHMALVDGKSILPKAGDDASDASWFRLTFGASGNGRYRLTLTHGDISLSALVTQAPDADCEGMKIVENQGLAFDHAKIIACAVQRLRNKLDYTDLALNLMPEQFTLTELQQVYETILDKSLLKAAFRRKVAHLVRETGEYTENTGHRPSQRFRRRED